MNDKKQSSEIARLIAAFGHACEGLKAARSQPAFRTEIIVALIAVPVALTLGHSGVERALMVGSVLLVLMVELLNTGIESAIDRISTEWHAISKIAKDVASAAVFLSIINAGAIWFLILFT